VTANIHKSLADWDADIIASVNLYNQWFMQFAPTAFRKERAKTTATVKQVFALTMNMADLKPVMLEHNPGILPTLRMATCPPIARDRLIGLAQVSKNLVKCMEEGAFPPRMKPPLIKRDLKRICDKITELLDGDLLPWVGTNAAPTPPEIGRSAIVIADRLCGAQADPIIRNAQEERQFLEIANWLTKRGYRNTPPHPAGQHPNTMPAGTFAFRMNVRVGGSEDSGNIPVDVAVQPRKLRVDRFPILIEAKSAGDFTNTNKRQKEEADKMKRLTECFGSVCFGSSVPYVLFLCGYFGRKYLDFESRSSIDWVWEHRIDDFALLGL
jgi:hypothetical protein